MIKKIISLTVVFCILLISSTAIRASAEAPDISATPDVPAIIIPVQINYSPDDIKILVNYYANLNHISSVDLMRVVKEESGFDQYAKGDGGKSLGACQIHDSNGISSEKRYDPHFCLDFMAKKIAEGKGRMWTAYRTCILHEVVYDNKGNRIICHS